MASPGIKNLFRFVNMGTDFKSGPKNQHYFRECEKSFIRLRRLRTLFHR